MTIKSFTEISVSLVFASNFFVNNSSRRSSWCPRTISLDDRNYSVRSTHIYICSDFNFVRPTHFLIVCTLSENENNIFMAWLSHLLYKRITFKTNFQLLHYTVYRFCFNFNSVRSTIYIFVSTWTVYNLPNSSLFAHYRRKHNSNP